MAFMERLQSALILNTSLYHPQEAHLVEHPEHEFYEAIKKSQYEQLEQMILEGFAVDFHEGAHTPPLIYAIMLKEYRAIELLLRYGASPNIRNAHSQTSLHVALYYRLHEVVHLLLRYGARVDTKDSDAITPIHLAELLDDEQSMTLLRHTPAMVQECFSPVECAKNGDLFGLVMAKESEASLLESDQKGNTLLHHAVRSRNITLLCYLLNSGLNIDASNRYGDTPLLVAARLANAEAVLQYLLDRHATLEHKNSAKETALILSIKFGHAKSAELLIDNGAAINTFVNINTPLSLTHDAISYYTESADAFRALESKLLIKGAHVDVITNKLGWTPLMQCATNAHTQYMLEHLELLIALGADVNHTDNNGRTALMLCITTHRREAINILLKHYADINIIDHFEWSALMFSCYYNNYNLTKRLLEYGADATFIASNGNSALKIAVKRDNKQIIQLLNSYGAVSQE